MDFVWQQIPKGVRRVLRWRTRAEVSAAVVLTRVLQFVEWFCGTGNLTTACSQQGLRVRWFDCTLDPSKMNLLTDAGFAAAIRLALSMMIGATAWFGVPCSTFVFMSRSHTKRSRTLPKGNCKRKDVRRANLIVDRVAFLIKILSLRKVYWIMEQPLNSLLWVMPAIARAKKNVRFEDWAGSAASSGWGTTDMCCGSRRS